MDNKSTDTDIAPSQKYPTIDEMDALVRGRIKKNGVENFKLTHQNWHTLQQELIGFLKLPVFQENLLGSLEASDKQCLELVYDESKSKVVRFEPLLQLFKNDLVRNMAVVIVKQNIPDELKNWTPFGGDEYYFELKDKWYSEGQKDLTHTWLSMKLDEIVSAQQTVKDPELPYWEGKFPHPSQIQISLINLHTLNIEWENEQVIVDCEKQIGLHGSEGLISKQTKEANANMMVLYDLWLHPAKELDMAHPHYQKFRTGVSPAQRDRASHQISKVNTALSKIVELAIDPDTGKPHTWFKLEDHVYTPKFIAGDGGFDIARDFMAGKQVRADVKDLPEYDNNTTPADLGFTSERTDRFGAIEDY